MSSEDSNKQSLLQDFLNFFPGARNPKAGDARKEEGPRVVSELSVIVAMMESALAIDNPVMVQIPKEPITYNTKFAIDAPPEMEALRRGEYIFVGPLDPPIGNIKVRKAPGVILRFFTERHIAELQVPYIATVEGAIKLGFPTEAIQNPQKRSSPRIQVLPEFNVKLSVLRPSGIPFDSKIIDISLGGALFCAIKDEARLADGSSVTLEITGSKFPSVQIGCVILGSSMKNDRPCYRTRFKGGPAEIQGMKVFISALVQEHRRKREWLFRSK